MKKKELFEEPNNGDENLYKNKTNLNINSFSPANVTVEYNMICNSCQNI